MKSITPMMVTALVLGVASADAQQAGRPAQTITITRRGLPSAQPSRTPEAIPGASNFTGSVRVQPVFTAIARGRTSGADVTFEPGARTVWHVHPAGQTLIVSAGIGRVQQWGSPVAEIRVGDVVRIPPGVKHWHGASPTDAMTHLGITETLDGRPTTEWMEPVPESLYRAAIRPPRPAGDTAAPSVTPRVMNELAPKLADITNRVLYGEVWPDAALSQRERSLITVSALIAMNRPDQLRSHLGRARANGVTRDEVGALITHLAFYAGWPSAVSALTVVSEVFTAP